LGEKVKVAMVCDDATKGMKEEWTLPFAKEETPEKIRAGKTRPGDDETVALLVPQKPPLVALPSILETIVLQEHNSWIIPFHFLSL
jgi:hypothetical protein